MLGNPALLTISIQYLFIHRLQSHTNKASKVLTLISPNAKKAKYRIKMNVPIISDDDEYRART